MANPIQNNGIQSTQKPLVKPGAANPIDPNLFNDILTEEFGKQPQFKPDMPYTLNLRDQIKSQENLVAQALPQQEDVDPLLQRRQGGQRPVIYGDDESTLFEGSYTSQKLEITPFQVFIDRAVTALSHVSELEFKVNDLMEGYMQGKVSIDEVSIETAKLNLAVTFVTTVITTGKDTFKEILGIQV